MEEFSQENQSKTGQADSFGKKEEDIYQSAQNGSLNHELENSLNMAISSICKGVEKAATYVNQELEKSSQESEKNRANSGGNGIPYGQNGYRQSRTGYNSYQRNVYSRPASGQYRAARVSPVCRPPKRGTVMRVFGWILTSIFGLLEFSFGVALGVTGIWGFYVTFMVLMPFFLLGLGLLAGGYHRKGRFNRYKQYVRELQGKPFGRIRDLARAIGKPESFTIKDLRRMITDGIFPNGHLDDEETYLMVTREVFDDYLRADSIRKQKKAEETAREVSAEPPQEDKQMDEKQRQVQEAVTEGRRYLEEIRQANEALPGEVISNKLDRLYDVTDRILYSVERQPDKLSEIKQFMKYYLPTTLKLVNAYREFEENPIQGSNILAAKEEIELSLDTINDGFEKLLNNLFEQDALDISTDIYVLQNMLAREGLAEDPFADISQEEGSVLGSNE